MSHIFSKQNIGFLLGAILAFSIGAIAIVGAHDVSAQALTADELFGGSADGDEFASTAGLGDADLTSTIAKVINIALGFLGIVAVVIILLGGFKWMVSGGNDTKVGEAKKLIYAGVTGLIIVISAYAIARFVIDSILSATTSSSSSSSS
jgi:hypothetical protein